MDHDELRTVFGVVHRELSKLDHHIPACIADRFKLALVRLIDHKIATIGYRLDVGNNMQSFFEGLDDHANDQEYNEHLKESETWVEQSHTTRKRKELSCDVFDPVLDFVGAINEDVYRYCSMHTRSRVLATEVVLILSTLLHNVPFREHSSYQDDTLTFDDVCKKFCMDDTKD